MKSKVNAEKQGTSLLGKHQILRPAPVFKITGDSVDELESPNKKEDIEELLSSFVYEDFCSELPIIKPITLTNIKQKTVKISPNLD